jgi:ribose 5-phosphate isomerase B
MKAVVAGDHFASDLAKKLSDRLSANNVDAINIGSQSEKDEKSLQEIIPLIVNRIIADEVDFGVLICGTGVGVEIGANQFKGIRASLCRDGQQARNSRVYDNANVLCLGSWYDDDFPAIIDAWLANAFDGDEGRIQMLKDFDSFS